MTWHELDARVRSAGLEHVPIGLVSLVCETPDDDEDIELFRNAGGTLTLSNLARLARTHDDAT